MIQTGILSDDTIVAISTPPGIGGIAIIRGSGKEAFSIIQKLFLKKNGQQFDWDKVHYRKMYYGIILENGQLIDEVMMCVFKAPHSFTGENMFEIYCHGSVYVQQKILQMCLNYGARLANAGEFTIRAYLNGKMNLAEAEAIGDIIHAESEAEHALAVKQLRGGYAEMINHLRENILNFASLLELELDFSEEYVEFANRKQLVELLQNTIEKIKELTDSFKMGNAIKNGIPVAIIGKPNAGKSTLLNTLLNDEKAIVSDIPGTTRDLIEDTLIINGIKFRIIDTAGIRDARDEIEKIGIERAKQSIQKAMIVISLFDVNEDKIYIETQEEWIKSINPEVYIIRAINKTDLKEIKEKSNETIYISAKYKNNIEKLKQKMYEAVIQKGYNQQHILVSNVRHYNELKEAQKYLEKAMNNLTGRASTEIVAEDLKFAIQHLSNITGQITSEDILKNIFSKFCIGK